MAREYLNMAGRVLLFITIFLFISFKSFSAVFTVTSNADSGPGTLREALTLAAANGSAEKDFINFNLPDLSEAGRTITILTDLPNLTSNLVIDGTTQPGNKIGYSDAKITLKTFRSTSKLVLFNGDGLETIAFYGIYFFDTTNLCISDPDGAEKIAISLRNSKNIILGSKNKGNISNGYKYNAFDFDNISGVYIAGNIFGQQPNAFEPVCSGGVSLHYVINAQIGDTEAGNTFLSPIQIVVPNINGSNQISVVNNNFGVASDGLTVIHYIDGGFITIASNLPTPTELQPKINLNVSGNLFSHYGSTLGGLVVSRIDGTINIKHNWFGTDRTATIPLNLKKAHPGDGTALYLEDLMADVVVGDVDPAQGNKIAYSYMGIIAYNCKNVKVIRNSFKCIDNKEYLYGPDNMPQITVTTNTGQYIAGKSDAGALVDIFLSDDCTNCSPETYLGSTTADAAGLWKYTFLQPYAHSIIANAHVGKRSSDFTKPQINASKIQITHFDCGNSGKISGITVSNTDKVKWVDEQGNVVSTSIELKNARPGRYKLIIGEYCTVESDYFTINDNSPHIYDAFITTSAPACNQNNGSIKNLFAFTADNQAISYIWIDQDLKEVGHEANITNLPPGKYTLKAKSASGCEDTYGPVILNASNGPVIDQSHADIQPTPCGQSTGAIKNIVVTGTDNIKYSWLNALHQEVATSNDLTGQPAGIYTLKVTDDSQCGPIYSSEIEIPEVNGITLDENNVIRTPTTCSQNNGSIKGITAPGATHYKWVNTTNNSIAGISADLPNAAAGSYQLTVSNDFGCNKTTLAYTIDATPATVYPNYTANINNSCASQNNGSITVIPTDNLVKAARWIDAGGQPAGTGLNISNLKPGTYKVYFTDANGCETPYPHDLTVTDIPPLQIVDNSGIQTNDQCGLKTGSIKNIQVTGGTPPYTYLWVDEAGNHLSTSKDLTGVGEGTYSLQVHDSGSSTCSPSAGIAFNISNQNSTIDAPVINPLQLCAPGEALLTVNSPAAGNKYRLYNSLTDPTYLDEQANGIFKISANNNSTYYISRVNGQCESERATAQITISLSAIDIPNTFTPNGDGNNDYWKINNAQNYPQAIVQVFTRYGQKVFESKGYGVPFDGTYKGSKLPAGVYYYILNLGKSCNLLSGSLTIIR